MSCDHQHFIKLTEPASGVCADCKERGDHWVSLRMCMTCGYVGCCDSSKNKHSRKHYMRADHPIIRSIEKGEDWKYCYIHKDYIE